MLSALMAVVRAVAGRLLLAAIFGTIAILLGQQVVGNMADRWGSAPQMTPAAAVSVAP